MSDWPIYAAVAVAIYLYVIGLLIGIRMLKDEELLWRNVLLVAFWPIIAPLALMFGDR